MRTRADTLDALWQDLTIGARVLRKSPAFTLSAILTLALGIGANAAVFTIVDDLILKPLAYEHADRLVTVIERHEKGGSGNMPYANLVDVEAQSHSFDGLGAYGSAPTTVIVNGRGLRVRAGVFSAGFFKAFSVRPVLGRLPSPDEGRTGANPVAVVSYAFWRDDLGAPASLDTVHITLSRATPVIGVLPNGFDFPDGNQVWMPMESMSQSMSRTAHNWDVVGRLRDGVKISDARRDVDGILSRLKDAYYPQFDAVGAEITPLQAAMTSSVRAPLLLLLAASAVLLLGACVNIASTLLARATARSPEFAVRSALGATRIRLMRQLLTESVLLAFVGCIAGLVLASALLRALPLVAPSSIHLERVRVDARVEGVALVVAALTAVVFGLLPALRLSGRQSALTLREGSRGTAGVTRMRAWNVLVGAEVALAVILLSGSALLIRSFARVMETPLGFETRHVYTVDVDLPSATYADSAGAVHVFHERVLDRLRRASGVDAAGVANRLPLAGNNPSGGMIVEGRPLDPRGPFNGNAVYRIVGGDFFAAMGIPVVRGRVFRAGDDDPRAPVVVVNEEFARREWPGEGDPLGKRVKVSGMDFNGTGKLFAWSTVVGVVGNV